MSPTAAQVAIVTGGASGMGLSVVEELVRRGWHVLILDLNAEAGKKHAQRLGDAVTFLQTDVTDYDQLSQAFVQTRKRHQRLDLVFANAGIGDLQSFYDPVAPRSEDEADAPPPPNMRVLDACLTHVVHAAWLALHYFRKNDSHAGKFVATSSMCGLYPGEGIPLYTAAKHGVVGLTRALARRMLMREEPITFNCICPGLVDTGLTNNTLMPFAPAELVTPHATIVRAVMGFVDDAGKTGCVAECSVENVHYRAQPDFGDKEAERLMTASWERMMAERREKGREDGKADSVVGGASAEV